MSRCLEAGERIILEILLPAYGLPSDTFGPLDELVVEDMSDGGMGSFRVVSTVAERRMGSQVAEGWYEDSDGVLVSVTINLDEYGALFELDSMKLNAMPRLRLPRVVDDVHVGSMPR